MMMQGVRIAKIEYLPKHTEGAGWYWWVFFRADCWGPYPTADAAAANARKHGYKLKSELN
jgi:hypothetical protein